MKTLYLFVLACCLGMLIKPVYQLAKDEEDSHVACDNSGAEDSASRYHNCDCNRAHAECGPQHPKPDAMQGCKTYCRKEACDCSTKSCS